jgi:hypothetical protein
VLPSALLAAVAAIAKEAPAPSSSNMTPVAAAVATVVPALALEHNVVTRGRYLTTRHCPVPAG